MKPVILVLAALLFSTQALAQGAFGKDALEKVKPAPAPAAPAATPATPAAPAAAPAVPAAATGRANQALQTVEAKGADAEKKAGEKADAKLTEGEQKIGVPGAAGQAKAAAAKEGQKAKKAKAKGHQKAKGAADKVDAATPKL